MIQLLANTVWASAAQLKITDTSDVDLAASDNEGLEILTTGPRHLYHSQGTAARRYVYVNKTNDLTFDTFVMTRADRHVGHAFTLAWYDPYPATPTTLVSSSNWAPTLIGPRDQDYVYLGSAVTGQAAAFTLDSGTGGAYSKQVSQGYFCTALNLSQHSNLAISPYWGKITTRKQVYSVQERIRFIVEQLTRAQVETLETLYRVQDDPIFLYDSNGYWITDGLCHCVITGLQVTPMYNDLHVVAFDVARLRDYA